jgi:hypothetical protein
VQRRARELVLAELLERAAQAQRAAQREGEPVRRRERDTGRCTGQHDAARGQERGPVADRERVVARLAAACDRHVRAQPARRHLLGHAREQRDRIEQQELGVRVLADLEALARIDLEPDRQTARAARRRGGEQLASAHEPRSRRQEAGLTLRLDEARPGPVTPAFTMIASRSVTSFATKNALCSSSASRVGSASSATSDSSTKPSSTS